MKREEIEFEARLTEAFQTPMERFDHVDVTRPVLAEVTRTDRRRTLVLMAAVGLGSLIAFAVAAATGLLQGLGQLSGALVTGGTVPLTDPTFAGVLTWTLVLAVGTLVTLGTAHGALQDF